MNCGTQTQRLCARALAGGALLVIWATPPAIADYPSTILSQQPAGYWRLNETTPPPVPQTTATNLGSLGTPADGMYTNGTVKGVSGALAGDPANKAAAFNG